MARYPKPFVFLAVEVTTDVCHDINPKDGTKRLALGRRVGEVTQRDHDMTNHTNEKYAICGLDIKPYAVQGPEKPRPRKNIRSGIITAPWQGQRKANEYPSV